MEQEQVLDWVHLPRGVEEVSLYSCLHDGKLTSSTSSLRERTLKLEFYVKHLLTDEEKRDKVRFLFSVENPTSVRATAHLPPVERCEDTRGMDELESRRKDFDKDKLIKLGQEYWESFGK